MAKNYIKQLVAAKILEVVGIIPKAPTTDLTTKCDNCGVELPINEAFTPYNGEIDESIGEWFCKRCFEKLGG